MIAGLATLFALSSCYHEDKIISELGEPKYHFEDGSDYVTHTIYDIYKRTGLQIVYDFDPDYARWNIGSYSGSDLFYTTIDPEKSEDIEVVADNLRYIDEHFFTPYGDDFIRKNFPVRCYLADSIFEYSGENKIFATSLRDHLAINLYREGEVIEDDASTYETRDEAMKAMVSQLHATLWSFIFTYRTSAPEHFTSFSSDYYGQNIGKRQAAPDGSGEDMEHKRDVLMSHGFWDYDDYNSGQAYYMAYKQPDDIADYIFRMTTMSESEILEAMGDYTIMHEKYNALRSYIIETTGLDLQSIGNAAAAERQSQGQ